VRLGRRAAHLHIAFRFVHAPILRKNDGGSVLATHSSGRSGLKVSGDFGGGFRHPEATFLPWAVRLRLSPLGGQRRSAGKGPGVTSRFALACLDGVTIDSSR